MIARLCEPHHTLHVNVWRILIEQLPKGFAETAWASGSKGAVGWHSLTYFCLTIIRSRDVAHLLPMSRPQRTTIMSARSTLVAAALLTAAAVPASGQTAGLVAGPTNGLPIPREKAHGPWPTPHSPRHRHRIIRRRDFVPWRLSTSQRHHTPA